MNDLNYFLVKSNWSHGHFPLHKNNIYLLTLNTKATRYKEPHAEAEKLNGINEMIK